MQKHAPLKCKHKPIFIYKKCYIRYDSGYLTCSKKLTGSQLSLPRGINRKLKCETKNKMMSVMCVHIAVHSCDTIQHKTFMIIFLLILETIFIA